MFLFIKKINDPNMYIMSAFITHKESVLSDIARDFLLEHVTSI